MVYNTQPWESRGKIGIYPYLNKNKLFAQVTRIRKQCCLTPPSLSSAYNNPTNTFFFFLRKNKASILLFLTIENNQSGTIESQDTT